MAYCTGCGTVTEGDAAFCSKCGRSFSQASEGEPLSQLDLSFQRRAEKKGILASTSLPFRYAIAGLAAVTLLGGIIAYLPGLINDATSSDKTSSTAASNKSDSGSRGLAGGMTDPGSGADGISPAEAISAALSAKERVERMNSGDPEEMVAETQRFYRENDSDIARRGKFTVITRELAVYFATRDAYPDALDEGFESAIGFPLDDKTYSYVPTANRYGYRLEVDLEGEYPSDEVAIYLDGGYKLASQMEGMDPVMVESDARP